MRIGIDTGGTFTDFVSIRDGKIEIFKEPSTPQAPEQAILTGLDPALPSGRAEISEIIHGSTVATNALLERKGARTALVTTAGFEDVLIIGRQTRPDLYDIFTSRLPPLIDDSLRIGVRQRTLHDGTNVVELKPSDLRRLVSRLRKAKVESIAVSLLFSFQNPSHELQIRDALEKLKVPISLSSVILPEYREYERTSTTVINAYLAPVMGRYLGRLERALSGPSLRVMQSSGGTVKTETAVTEPVRTILSGPAGGVVGALSVARRAGFSKIITFDMGGTSTDVALFDGAIRVSHESEVGGMPIGIPMMDIHTVGAGGGSIAEVDAGGALRVGPESAGADPGPICYGTGTSFTVTDANVVLGRLLPRFFLGGGMKLASERIGPAVGQTASSRRWVRKWKNIESLAAGVVDVVNNNMEQAIRLISIERGHDVRDFTLVCFGGGGALHAATLAEGLGIPRVVVPPHPGALSALGLLLADTRKDYSSTLLGTRPSASNIRKALSRLHREGLADLKEEGFRRKDIVMVDFLDVRYVGQSYELSIPYSDDWAREFHLAHETRYGHFDPDSPLEVVSVRSTLTGTIAKPVLPSFRRRERRPVPLERVSLWFGRGRLKVDVYDRQLLGYGNVIIGPAIIGEYSSTTFVPPGFQCDVDKFGNLILMKKGNQRRGAKTQRKRSQ
jgi:N-methylhydantoinase A